MVALTGSFPAVGYNWDNSYNAVLETGYHRNYLLSSPEVNTFSSELGLIGFTKGKTETSSIEFSGRVFSQDFSDSEVDGETTLGVGLALDKKTERALWVLSADVDSSPTADAELLDTGIIVSGGKTETYDVKPSVTYSFTERNLGTIGFSFEENRFDSDLLVESTTQIVFLEWAYRLNEQDAFSTKIDFGEFEPEDDDTTEVSSISFSYRLAPAQKTVYLFSIGYSDVDGPDNTDSGFTYGASVESQVDDRNLYKLSLNHIFDASDTGVVREEDNFTAELVHGLTDKTDALLAFELVKADDQEATQVAIGFNYKYSKAILLTTEYEHQQVDFGADAESSNAVLFTILFAPE